MGLFFERPDFLPDIPHPLDFSCTTAEIDYGPVVAVADKAFDVISPDILLEMSREYGEVVAFSKQGSLHFLISNPSLIVEILATQADLFLKGEQEVAFSASVGYGLLGDEGESHKMQQRALSPGMRGAALDNHAVAIVDTLVSRFQETQGVVPLLQWCREFSQESVERALFPTEARISDYRYQAAIGRLNELVMSGIPGALSGSEAAEVVRAVLAEREFVHSYVGEIVDEWRNRSSHQASLMDFMVESPADGPEVTTSLTSQVAVFLQAGMETTGSLVAWSLLMLSKHPHYWDYLRRDLDSEGTLSAMEVIRLPHIKRFIDETLRLYPSAWLLPRIASEGVVMEGVTIPGGARVIVSPWVTHRAPTYFDDPQSFRPERWEEGASPPLVRGAYFPFGLGKRICIGEHYGKLSTALVLRQLALLEAPPVVMEPDASVGTANMVANPRDSLMLAFS
jgi:cytochrome P450